MTVIAYRDGMIAADSLMCIGSARTGTTTKIARNSTGDLAAGAGSAAFMEAFLGWFRNLEGGAKPEAKRDGEYCDRGIIVRRESSEIIEVYEAEGKFHAHTPFYALGCGAAEARGAMQLGATAEEAVRVAIALDVYCGGPVTVLTFKRG